MGMLLKTSRVAGDLAAGLEELLPVFTGVVTCKLSKRSHTS